IKLADAAMVADFNSDGAPDLVWRNTANGATYIWRMDGIVLMSDQFLAAIDPAWTIVGIADFDGDGQNDVIWRNATSGNAYVWYLDNGAFVRDAFLFNVDPVWIVEAVAAFS